MHSDYMSFQDAVQKLREFLDRHRWPVDLRWLPSDTVAARDGRLILHADRFQSMDDVRIAYWYAVPKKRGVLLAGLCRDLDFSYCHLWAPVDEDEADDHLMPDGLKLSIPEQPPEVIVTKGLRYRWSRRRSRKTHLEGLMLSYPSAPGLEQVHV